MKKYNLFIAALFLVAAFTSCEKKVESIDDTFSVGVEFRNSGTGFVTSSAELNPKDSFFLDLTVTSPDEDMSWIEIKRNDTRVDTVRLTGSKMRSVSIQRRYRADSAAGDYAYRVLAYNSRGVYMGDGGKLVRITVKPDFVYWTYRFLYVPDSVSKTAKTYFSTSTGNTFSYNDGNGNSSSIDFGFMYDTTTTGTPKHTLYALTNNSLFAPYDLSSWTKNATVFKRITTPSFTNMTSGGILRTTGITNLASGATTKITQLAAGNVIIFRTAAGKYGAVNINFVEGTSASPGTYINIDVKVEK